jgi:ABC-type branched-subunit amino acid transport system substrate-binding protein
MAIREINDKNDGILDDLLPETKFVVSARSNQDILLQGALSASEHLEAFNGQGIQACIGPSQDLPSYSSQLLYAEALVPQISYGASTAQLGNAATYALFARTYPSNSFQGRAASFLISQHFHWHKVGIFHSSDFERTEIAEQFIHGNENHANLDSKISVKFRESFHDEDSFVDAIKTSKEIGIRIIYLALELSEAARFLFHAWQEGLLTVGVQVIGTDELGKPALFDELLSYVSYDEAMIILKGFFSLHLIKEPVESDMLHHWIARWRSQPNTNGYLSSNGQWKCNNETDDDGGFSYYESVADSSTKICLGYDFKNDFGPYGENIDPKAYYAYDATVALAKALHDMYYVGISDYDGPTLFERLVALESFEGVTGTVDFDEGDDGPQKFGRGDRLKGIRYAILNFQGEILANQSIGRGFSSEELFALTGVVDSKDGFSPCTDEALNSFSNQCLPLIFHTKGNSHPSDVPEVQIVRMPTFERALIIIFAIFALSFTSLVLMGMFKFRAHKIMKASQPILSLVIAIGLLLGGAFALLQAFDVTLLTCYLDLWLFQLSYFSVLVAMTMKSYRVHLVINSKGIRRVKFTAADAMKRLLVVMSLLVLYLILMSAFAGISVDYYREFEHLYQTDYPKCTVKTEAFSILLKVIEVLVFVIAIRYTHAVRGAPSAVNEFGDIAKGKILNRVFRHRADLLVTQ